MIQPMPPKEVFAPHLGRSVKLARRPPRAHCPRLKLSAYVTKDMPPPPDSCDYSPAATPSLSNALLNTQLGDCVIAGGYHCVGLFTGNAGSLFVPTPEQVIADYSAIGGYIPGNAATDQGCDEQTALNYWTQHGFANGTKLAGWACVDATNITECMQACFLFEHLYFGVGLPDKWISPFPSANGFVWDAGVGASDPNNGHCYIAKGYTQQGPGIDTWGLLGTETWAALAAYTDELYVMLSPDMLAKGQAKAPNGIAWADLMSDISVLNGSAPAPAPQPTPPVPQCITLAAAQAAASKGLADLWATMPQP